jgi:aspartate/methionine/tyrosine aminotransferase
LSFSARLDWSLAPNAITRLLDARRRAGQTVIDLTVSNPIKAGLDLGSERVLPWLARPASLDYEPTPAGLLVAREAVAAYHERSRASVSPEDIVLTASTSEAYAFLFKILADCGETIAVPRPSYPLLEYLAAVEGASTEAYDLEYDGTWRIDFDSLTRATGDRTRAVVCVHPNNPTGSYVGRLERDRLVGFCRERDLALVIDEVFFDYPIAPDEEAAGSFAGIECESSTFVLSGLSKLVGLPQMKLAWICLGGPANSRREARMRLEHVADLFLSVGTPVQQATPDLLRPEFVAQAQTTIRKRVLANYAALGQSMAKTPAVSQLNVEGGWYGVLRLPAVRSDEEWCLELLACEGVYAHPGHFFDFRSDAYLVVSLLTPEDAFAAGLEAIARRVNATVTA